MSDPRHARACSSCGYGCAVADERGRCRDCAADAETSPAVPSALARRASATSGTRPCVRPPAHDPRCEGCGLCLETLRGDAPELTWGDDDA